MAFDIAVVGMSCKFPGANSHQQFWNNIEMGISAIQEISSQKWDTEKYYSNTKNTPHKSISKWVGCIDEPEGFDAHFFNTSPKEAESIDPQQRLMLELSWSCIEDAGYSPTQLAGQKVGVFIGACNYDYDLFQNSDVELVDGYSGTGTWACMLPNRISNFLNFHGPSLTIDTACSSSLVALHYAANSILFQESHVALAGGVSLIFTPARYIQFSQLGMLSATGPCKSFDSRADGYCRGEGAGFVLLKPLEQAVKDKDRIYGVIKSSAVNHGGKARTLTSPNVYAQSQVVKEAIEQANIHPSTISYIETHGTGTPLGDPIEINALKRAFRQFQHQAPQIGGQPYCGLGTVKTNIGHLEGAAGIAGLIKVLLALQHQKLPTLANFQKLNPRINLKDSPFYIIDSTKKWEVRATKAGDTALCPVIKYTNQTKVPLNKGDLGGSNVPHSRAKCCIIPRRAGISSFGIGGTNAHVIVEEAPLPPISEETYVNQPLNLLPLSAKTEPGLQDLVSSYQQHLKTYPNLALKDVCYTASAGRTHFGDRCAIVASNTQELEKKLQHYQNGEKVPDIVIGDRSPGNPSKLAYLFTGQGCQDMGMGQVLYETQPKFQQTINTCAEILREHLELPLLEVLFPSEGENSPIHETAYTQPCLFALEYALAILWQSWGITPDIVLGHSIGEYVAACLAGVFSLEDGLKLIAARGRLMQALPAGGAMAAVMTDAGTIGEILQSVGVETVSIAAVNGPENTVIAGLYDEMNQVICTCEAKGLKVTILKVSHAFHSVLMEPMLAEFLAVAEQINYQTPHLPIISNVTGKLATDQIATAAYWVEHVSRPIQFAQSMKTLAEQGYNIFLELGPKPILLGMGQHCVSIKHSLWLPSLYPKQGSDWQILLRSLAQLYVRGVRIDWSGFYQGYGHQKVSLPTYPFQRKRYWNEAVTEKLEQTRRATQPQTIMLEPTTDPIEPVELPPPSSPVVPEQQMGMAANPAISSRQSLDGSDINQHADIILHQLNVMSQQLELWQQQELEITWQQPFPTPHPFFPNLIAYHKPRSETTLRLFCLHELGGSAYTFSDWSEYLPPQIEIVPIELPGREGSGSEQPFSSFLSAVQVLAGVFTAYQDKPFAIWGQSLGALIAFELAHLLNQQYEMNPLHLFVSTAWPPNILLDHLEEMRTISPDTLLSSFLGRLEVPPHLAEDRQLTELLETRLQADLPLLLSYQQNYSQNQPLNCSISAFGGLEDQEVLEEELSHWHHYTHNQFKLHMFHGQHNSFVRRNKNSILTSMGETLNQLITTFTVP
ncbi:MAG: acyltransferase domain-containing protein [Symploca sp. SIO1A3]|nr:acyltransferase domain-containing protein [Symploca sp. SIO1A3]